MVAQSDLWRNLTGTVCVIGLALSSANLNGTQVVNLINDVPQASYGIICPYLRQETAVWPSYYTHGIVDEQTYATTNKVHTGMNNVYVEKHKNKLESEAESLFGPMREATKEESTSVNNYVKSISKDTGVKFFDLC